MDLTSARLVMRPLDDADFADLHALLTEPGVRRYLCDNVIIPESHTREYLQRSCELWANESAGLWGVWRPGETNLLGIVGYWYFHEPARLELLYALSERVWHIGYATEAARCMINYGRQHLGLTTVLASTDTPNSASIKVLERLGFVMTERRTSHGLDTSFFSLHA
jgi:[ribosomal protein S5]-alanine N-acetyltransferase